MKWNGYSIYIYCIYTQNVMTAESHLLFELVYLSCSSLQSASVSVQQLLVLSKPLQLLLQGRHFLSVLVLQYTHLERLVTLHIQNGYTLSIKPKILMHIQYKGLAEIGSSL